MIEKTLSSHLMGTDTSHDTDFVYDVAPNTNHRALIMCFRSPAVILTVNGMMDARAGDCIIQDPGFRYYHTSVADAREGFRNDWLHADHKVTRSIVKRLKLPWNKLIQTEQPDIMAEYIRRFMSELENEDEFSKVIIDNTLFEMLSTILRATREREMKNDTLSPTERDYYEKFKQLRRRILEDCITPLNVKELAEQVNLSPERFSVLYKKFFNISPISERLDARIALAKRILVYSNKSIKETALECGFEDLHYFSRLFKRRTSISPSHYRRHSAHC